MDLNAFNFSEQPVDPEMSVDPLLGGLSHEQMENSVDVMNSLLRGEISAVETYRIAMDKIAESNSPPQSMAGVLYEIQLEHGQAAQLIRYRIRELGGEAADSSGTWGTWAKMAVGVAKIFGIPAMLRSLREGEDLGLRDFRHAVAELDVNSVTLIDGQLIPNQHRHLRLLDQLIGSNEQAA